MARWQIKQNMKAELITAFEVVGCDTNQEIADAAHVNISNVDRLLTAEKYLTSSENLRRLFACVLGYIDFHTDLVSSDADNKTVSKEVKTLLTAEQCRLIAAERRKYCHKLDAAGRIIEDETSTLEAQTNSDASPIACMTVYAKVTHLTDRTRCQPAYHKFIPRFKKQFPIYDEISLVRSLLFNIVPKKYTVHGHRRGIVDLQMLCPKRLAINEHTNTRGPEGEDEDDFQSSGDITIEDQVESDIPSLDTVEHLELEPQRLIQSVHSMYNCFQRKQEYIGSIIREDCDRLILVADLTSLPFDVTTFFRKPPIGEVVRVLKGDSDESKTQKIKMAVQQAKTGMFILDSDVAYEGKQTGRTEDWDPNKHKVLVDDKYYIRFFLNWDLIAQTCGGQS